MEEARDSFEALKVKLTNAPVLAYADFFQPFILEIDASYGGLGVVLSQEQRGKVMPIAYASRGLRPTERNMANYSSMKLEFLALKVPRVSVGIKYRCGRSNRNADALSRQHSPGPLDIAAMLPDTPLPEPLHLKVSKTVVTQATVTVLPEKTSDDIRTLQQADSVIQEVQSYWEERRRPSYAQ